jgi:trigger factor
VDEADVETQLENLRERFAVLTGVDRPAAEGDYVSIDLAAIVDGDAIDDLSAKGLSYQVGQGSLLQGLDDAVTGLAFGESKVFTTELVGPEHGGKSAEVTVTVNSVKERELPGLDDEFAQTASEFDTLDELRADLRARLERVKMVEQAVQARDRALDALLAKVDIPLPQSIVDSEVEGRREALDEQLERSGITREAFLAAEEQTEEEFVAQIEERARHALTSQFVLDKVVAEEKLSIEERELTEHIVRTASRYGMSPDQFAQQVVQAGQVPMLVSEVVRGKALALILEAAKLVDEAGRPVDLEALREETTEEDVVPG